MDRRSVAVVAAPIQTQQPEAPLNLTALANLRELSKRKHDQLNQNLTKAASLLTQIAGDINERAQEVRQRHEKKLERLGAKGEEENEDERQEFDAFQAKVQDLTDKMDRSIRKVVDDRVWVEDLPTVLQKVETTSAQPPTRSHPQRSQNEDEQDDDAMNLDATNEQEPTTIDPDKVPTTLFRNTLSARSTEWNSKSLTDRYAYDNDYIGFYKGLHDAKHPEEEAPPLPAASIWFAREEGTDSALSQTQRSAVGGDDEEDSDVEVAREKVRIRCPLTFLPYQDPVTSVKCKHSFEKTAILDMLKGSDEHVPWTRDQLTELNTGPRKDRHLRERQMRAQQVRCPECNVPFTESDLRPNPILLRKVRRALERERREDQVATSDVDASEEDDEEVQIARRGTQRRQHNLDSSPMTQAKIRRKGKVESRMSLVPQTQLSDSESPEMADGSTEVA